jgi:ferredoxin
VSATTPPPGPPRRDTTAAAPVLVAVHNGHCGHYGICVQEAPEVFSLRSPTRLVYDATPAAEHTPAVRQAARLCPAQAITLGAARTRGAKP